MLQGGNTTIKLDGNHVSNELKDDSKLVQRFLGETKIQNDLSTFKHNLPHFLQQNKDICQQRYLPVEQYGHEHLHELSMELMCKYLHDMILSKMVEEQLGVVRGVDSEVYDNEL